MLAKRSIKAQITSGAENCTIEVQEWNRRVIMKLIETVYFMAWKKWAVKNNFKYVVEFVKDLGDADLEKHFRDMGKMQLNLSTPCVTMCQHVSPFTLYLNCRNHQLALCLVHLMKEYKDLVSIDVLLMAAWKISSTVRLGRQCSRMSRFLKTWLL